MTYTFGHVTIPLNISHGNPGFKRTSIVSYINASILIELWVEDNGIVSE